MFATSIRRAIRPVAAAAFSGLLLTPLAANAWGPGGRMIVAQIAYDKISAEDPTAKAEIDQLIAISIAPKSVTAKSSDFVNAAHWADDDCI